MRKVKHTFFCMQTKKKYFPGDVYDGKRKDLEWALEPQEKKEGKPRRSKKEK